MQDNQYIHPIRGYFWDVTEMSEDVPIAMDTRFSNMPYLPGPGHPYSCCSLRLYYGGGGGALATCACNPQRHDINRNMDILQYLLQPPRFCQLIEQFS